MRAIVSVIGKDQVGIIANVCSLLAANDINILDISQTVLQDFFTRVMLVDLSACGKQFSEIAELLKKDGEDRGLVIRIQSEDIFEAMHRI